MPESNQKIAPDSVNNGTNIGAGGSQSSAKIEDRAGLYIAIVALILAVLSIGLVIMMPIVIEAKVQAGIERARADMQEQVAEAKQIANTGREHGRIALSEVERANEELAGKGLIRRATH